VPSFAEQGFDHPVVTLSGWLGILTTAGTPRSSITLLNQWVRAALEQPEIRAEIETYGLEVTASTPEEFEAGFRAEVRNWLTMVNDFGIRLD
jgi:tripartite-type tricarboxylate transporter receptor subunit TctC